MYKLRSKRMLAPLFTGLCLLCLLIFPQVSRAQSASWTLQGQEGDVNAYAKLDNCAGESGQTFFVKFENVSTSDNYEISYEILIINGMTFPPMVGTVTVKASESIEGDCTKAPMEGLRLFTEPGLNSLSDLQINYTVKKL